MRRPMKNTHMINVLAERGKEREPGGRNMRVVRRKKKRIVMTEKR